MLLFGPRSRSLANSSLSTGASSLCNSSDLPTALSGGVSARHILRPRFLKTLGNLLLKWQGQGAYMPCRSWPEGSVASSAVASSLSLGQRWKWQREHKDCYKPLLHSEPSLNTCMVQVPLPHPWGQEKSCCPPRQRLSPT